MAELTRTRSVLAVQDLATSVDYYTRVLGTVDGIDEFYSELMGNGATLIQTLADKPWRMREFGVRTPDGHRIMFGQEL